jgi:hypothetical protein
MRQNHLAHCDRLHMFPHTHAKDKLLAGMIDLEPLIYSRHYALCSKLMCTLTNCFRRNVGLACYDHTYIQVAVPIAGLDYQIEYSRAAYISIPLHDIVCYRDCCV